MHAPCQGSPEGEQTPKAKSQTPNNRLNYELVLLHREGHVCHTPTPSGELMHLPNSSLLWCLVVGVWRFSPLWFQLDELIPVEAQERRLPSFDRRIDEKDAGAEENGCDRHFIEKNLF